MATDLRPDRRRMLREAGTGFGLLGLAALLADEARADAPRRPGPHHPAKAKSVIFLFMPGGPSHVDTFDPKPLLTRDDGKPLPFEKPKLKRGNTGNLLGSPYTFSKHGRAGVEVSELFPEVAKRIDDVCVIRSMVADNINHSGARLQMLTGEQTFSRPSLGSWLLYGLGSETKDLPGFVAVSPKLPPGGQQLWGSSFLPAAHQGTWVQDPGRPIGNLSNPTVPPSAQEAQLAALKALNERHLSGREDDTRLSARIESFELAFRMQAAAPEAFDLSRESARTGERYGIGTPLTDTFGRQCLLARRLVERGTRMVQLLHCEAGKRAESSLWDQHNDLRRDLPENCAAVDKPIAGLLDDLKGRGLLDETLVVWGGEFGRTPTVEGRNGREHNPFGFSMWLAGGGIKGGLAYGATDDYGWHAVQDRVHVHDLHATILHLMGLDHERLTYRHSGRDYRLTDVHGRVVHDIIA